MLLFSNLSACMFKIRERRIFFLCVMQPDFKISLNFKTFCSVSPAAFSVRQNKYLSSVNNEIASVSEGVHSETATWLNY